MKELKVIKERNPDVTEYKVFDDYLEAHKYIANRDEFTFKYNPVDYWSRRQINGTIYYQKQYYGWENTLLTEDAYNDLLQNARKSYSIHESDLVRHGKNSNCRFTGDLDSPDKVISYMRNDVISWLPEVYEDIDEEIAVLQRKIDTLNEQKNTLKDDNHLRNNITMDIIVESKKVREE